MALTGEGAKPAEVFSIAADNRMQAEGVAIITSSSAWEDSHESERLRVFLYPSFLTALRGAADQDKDSTVTWNEAYSFLIVRPCGPVDERKVFSTQPIAMTSREKATYR